MRLDVAAEVRPDERFDEASLEAYLRRRLPELRGPFSVQQFRGGHANLTYLVRIGDGELVLRRPPLGPVAPKSHDMAREHRALEALAPLYPFAPRPLLLCEDLSIIGAVFFAMERRRGIVIRQEWPAELGDDRALRRRIGFAVIDGLADLHRIDVARPEIAALGKPEGFVRRQVEGWYERWQRARTRDLPVMDDLCRWLADRMPQSDAVGVVHNDWKLDNAMLSVEDPGCLVAVFDWDMTTLGDPLVDLGTFLSYWAQAGDETPRGTGVTVSALPGFPTREELADRYRARTGADLAALPWYETFGLFKTAVVLEQIYVRFVRGQTRDERFKLLGEYVPLLAEAARRSASQL
jgi:aminoglycoside phosphotransferase (APT) family kinase protein